MKAWIWVGAVSIWSAIGIEVVSWFDRGLSNRISAGLTGFVVFSILMSILVGGVAVVASLLLAVLGLGMRR